MPFAFFPLPSFLFRKERTMAVCHLAGFAQQPHVSAELSHGAIARRRRCGRRSQHDGDDLFRGEQRSPQNGSPHLFPGKGTQGINDYDWGKFLLFAAGHFGSSAPKLKSAASRNDPRAAFGIGRNRSNQGSTFVRDASARGNRRCTLSGQDLQVGCPVHCDSGGGDESGGWNSIR
jgi:hypothetical protein